MNPKSKLLILIISMTILFCGCAPPEITETVPVSESVYAESSTSLFMSAGSYADRFTNTESGVSLDYYLFVPENAVEGMPLVIFLHGDGEVGQVNRLETNPMIAQVKEIYGDEYPFIGLAPCSYINSWTYGPIPTTLKMLIDETVQNYSINPEQIIITGHSRGATGVYYMISTYADYFSAAVPISCPSIEVYNYEACAKTPIWSFVGTNGDDEYGYMSKMSAFTEQILNIGGNATLTILEGATHMETQSVAYTEESFRWMLQQERK